MNLPWKQNFHPIPEKLLLQTVNPLCRWTYAADHLFTEPFFSDTLAQLHGLEANRGRDIMISGMKEMIEWSYSVNAQEPSLFIFHVSRCGSTLVSQLLAQDPHHIVLSEVPFLDELLRLPFKKETEKLSQDVNRLFASALRIYGQKRTGNESKLIIKTDSWHLLFYHQFRQMYPRTPFVVIYRHPGEVLSSQQRRRGMHSVPGVIEPAVFGFTEKDFSIDFDLYMSRVLECYFETILKIQLEDPSCLLVNYNQGISGMISLILKKASIHPSVSMQQKMNERLLYHSKSPFETYQKDELMAFPPEILKKSLDLYDQLEEKRRSMT